MKIKVELNDEMADQIIRNELKWHYDMSKNTKHLLKEDVEYFKKLKPALEIVCDYFGVKTNDKKRNRNIR